MTPQQRYERKIGLFAVIVLAPLLIWVAVSEIIPRLIDAVIAAIE